MIKELAEFGWPDYWIDTSQIFVIKSISKVEEVDYKTGVASVTHRLGIVVGGESQAFLVNEDDLESLERLRDFFAEEMKKRDVA